MGLPGFMSNCFNSIIQKHAKYVRWSQNGNNSFLQRSPETARKFLEFVPNVEQEKELEKKFLKETKEIKRKKCEKFNTKMKSGE